VKEKRREMEKEQMEKRAGTEKKRRKRKRDEMRKRRGKERLRRCYRSLPRRAQHVMRLAL